MKTLHDLVQSPLRYVAYNASKELNLDSKEDSRQRMILDPDISKIVEELRDWPGPSISSHKSAQQFFHKFVFLADAGMKREDPGMKLVIDRILSTFDPDGVPTLTTTIPKSFGGTGERMQAWTLCDAPSTLYGLVRCGEERPEVAKGVKHLSGLIQENGYGCISSKTLGKWHGPGKRSDPCPYATLIMTKLLLAVDPERYRDQIHSGVDCLLDLWANSREKHPFIFYMGTDFRKLKLPFIWYDILHVLDVLSQEKTCHSDSRYLEMYTVVKEKETAEGWIPESIYTPWKSWDFGQKKEASHWMTFCLRRIEKRMGNPA